MESAGIQDLDRMYLEVQLYLPQLLLVGSADLSKMVAADWTVVVIMQHFLKFIENLKLITYFLEAKLKETKHQLLNPRQLA